MNKRPPIPSGTRKAILEANAGRCCVCRKYGLGLNIHHIDENPANNDPQNLAPICVEGHDHHHRPKAYKIQRHCSALKATTIWKRKRAWEKFVKLARQKPPLVRATITAYGTKKLVHAAELVVHTLDQKIGYHQVYHLHDGDFDHWTELILEVLCDLSQDIPISLVSRPMPVEHCPCCGKALSRMISKGLILRSTSPQWKCKSVCSVYVNPAQPSLMALVFFGKKEVFSWGLHLCKERFLHVHTESYDERIRIRPRTSVTNQVEGLVNHVLRQWNPGKVFWGTGDSDQPVLTDKLQLPESWERNRN